MTSPAGDRNLKRLVGDVGASYRHRMLPPIGFVALAVAASAAWMHASPDLLAAAAASACLLAGCVSHWPHRKRFVLPGWRTAGFLASLYTGLGGASRFDELAQPALALVGLMALVDMGLYVSRTIGKAEQLNEQVRNMDEHDLVALLPDEARADARRWQAGDDSKAAELALVLHLGALCMMLGVHRPDRNPHGIAAL